MITLLKFPGGINDQKNQIAAFESLVYLGHHLAAERTVGPVHSGGINEDYLPVRISFPLRNFENSQNAIARGLRLGADDGQFLPNQRVQQCRFASVRAAENANESGMKGHRTSLSEVEGPLLNQFHLLGSSE